MFEPHGQVEAHLEGRILITNLVGPFNVELIRHWIHLSMPLTQQLGLELPCGSISIVHRSMLSSPDAFDLLGKTLRHFSHTLYGVASACVADATVEGRNMIETTYMRQQARNLPQRFFYDLPSARAWVEEQIRAAPMPRP
jgi:hypothetical protein